MKVCKFLFSRELMLLLKFKVTETFSSICQPTSFIYVWKCTFFFSFFFLTVTNINFKLYHYVRFNRFILLSPGPLRLQDHFLRAGLHAAAAGGQRVRLDPELRRDRSDVERRLHHPKVHLTSLMSSYQKVCLTAALCNLLMSTGIFHTDGENCG